MEPLQYWNPLGDAGLAALLPALRRLPPLKVLGLEETSIGDEGVASLVAQPTAGALKSLERLDLDHNQMTDAGFATLVPPFPIYPPPLHAARLSVSLCLPPRVHPRRDDGICRPRRPVGRAPTLS